MAIKKVIEVEIKDNAVATQDHFNDLRNEIKKTEKEVDELSKTYGQNSKEVKESVKQLNKLQDAYNDLSKEATDLNATFEDIHKGMKPLTTRLGEAEDRLYELALAGKQGTREYQDLLEAASNFRKVQIQTDLVVDAAATTLGQKLGGALQGATSSFAAVQGAMAAMGVESEKVTEALLKVQGAMALSEGVRGIREAIPTFSFLGNTIKTKLVTAFSTLKGAIISTGIGALVVAIGLIIPKLIEWGNWTDRAKKKQENLNESLLKQQKAIKDNRAELEKDLDFRLRYSKALGKSDDELLKIQKKNAQEKKKLIFDEIDAAKKRLESLRNVDLGVMASSKEEYLELVADNRKKREEIVKEIKELRSQVKGINQDILISETELNTKQREESKKTTKEKKQDKQEEVAVNKDANKELIELQNEIEKTTQENFNRSLNQQDIEKQAVNDKYFALLEKAREYNQSTIELEIAQKEELNEINLKYAKIKQEEEDKARADKEAKDKEDLEKAKILERQKLDAVQNTFTTIGNLAELFAGQSEKQQKKAFKVKKAADTANAVIDTYKAATGAYASLAAIPVVGPVLGAAAAGAAVTAGLLNVKKIQSQQFGGGATGGGSSAPSFSAGGGSESRAPQFNIVGQGGVGQAQFLEQKPVQAFVVSGEVTSQQALDRNRLRNATL